MTPHTIRLRGAWAVTSDGPRFRHARPFGWPTALDPHERVWLVVGGSVANISLNGAPLPISTPGASHFESDITALLRLRNELILTRDTEAPPTEVSLEVRPAVSAAG